MCNTGECHFESYLGDCMINDFDKFKEKYGECACIVGGHIEDEEAKEYIAKNKDRLDAIYQQWVGEYYGR